MNLILYWLVFPLFEICIIVEGIKDIFPNISNPKASEPRFFSNWNLIFFPFSRLSQISLIGTSKDE